MTQHELDLSSGPGVTLFGVGGAGGNAVGRFFRRPGMGMKIICANTDVQALRAAPSASQIQLGRRLTGGLGAGAKPEIGRAAAQEALPEIDAALEGSSLCFIAAGLGGGTGTGAAPVIARAARERGILTIGIATRPFAFEGARRARTAAAGLVELQASVDALVVVCNENLLRVAGRETTFRHALDLSDSIVCDSARDFAALIAGPALKRVTIADIHAILDSGGRTVIGYGERCAGRGRATLAAESALRNPLLEDAPHGARRLLVTIAGGSDLGLFEVEEAVEYLREQVHASADLVWGSVIDPALDGRVRVGIAAAGLPERSTSAAPARAPATFRPEQSLAAIAVEPIPVEEPQAEPALVAACQREAMVAPAPALVAETHGIPPDEAEPLVAPTAILPEPEPGRAPLVLTSSYSLDLDIVADNPVSTRTIRSRARSASLIDQIYFAIQALKRPRASRPTAPARRAPRDIHIAWANSRPA